MITHVEDILHLGDVVDAAGVKLQLELVFYLFKAVSPVHLLFYFFLFKVLNYYINRA